jgi:hypothetical protein
VFPQRKHLPLRVRLWIDFLKHSYGDAGLLERLAVLVDGVLLAGRHWPRRPGSGSDSASTAAQAARIGDRVLNMGASFVGWMEGRDHERRGDSSMRPAAAMRQRAR